MNRSICLLVLILVGGCSSGPLKVDQNSYVNADIEINYIMGHYKHRFLVQASAREVVAQAFLDHDLVEKEVVDREEYGRFYEKTLAFLKGHEEGPAKAAVTAEPVAACRNPFTVSVRLADNGAKARSVSGCRTPAESTVSHLIKEGEFLLYSKK